MLTVTVLVLRGQGADADLIALITGLFAAFGTGGAVLISEFAAYRVERPEYRWRADRSN